MRCRYVVIALACLYVLHACGGGGGGGPQTTPVKVSIGWGARSRTINAPSSALSFTLTLSNANTVSGDFSFTQNRDAAPAAYTGNYTSTNSAKVGTWPLTVKFYAQADGGGAVVGIAQATVTIKSDGTGIGDITTANTVASVEVPAGQSVNVGVTKDLAFTAKDAENNVVAVTPGSALWNVVSRQDRLQIANGQAKGILGGTATVTATVDSKTSPVVSVTVACPLPQRYAVTDLGTLSGFQDSAAYSINDLGVAVGQSVNASNVAHATIWQNGTMTDLGPGVAHSINRSGQVVGSLVTTGHAFLWQSGQSTDLGTLPGYSDSGAFGINFAGQVVGQVDNPPTSPTIRAFLWQGGTMTDLGALSGAARTWTNGINDAGQVVGASDDHPVLWQNGQITDLGSLGGGSGEAFSINNNGQIVGKATTTSGEQHAFLRQNGQMMDLGTLGGNYGKAWAINDCGQIVGEANTSSQLSHAFIYSGSQMLDLNTMIPTNSGWVLTRAFGINNVGQIVGEGQFNGHERAFLLTPQ